MNLKSKSSLPKSQMGKNVLEMAVFVAHGGLDESVIATSLLGYYFVCSLGQSYHSFVCSLSTARFARAPLRSLTLMYHILVVRTHSARRHKRERDSENKARPSFGCLLVSRGRKRPDCGLVTQTAMYACAALYGSSVFALSISFSVIFFSKVINLVSNVFIHS